MASLMSRVGWAMGTGIGIGLVPFAPATWASLVAVVIYGFSPLDQDSIGFFLLCGIGFLVGIWACQTLITETDHDPKRAVLDEFAGMWITCLFLPKTFVWLALAFMVFRVLDIWKPWPIRKFEALPGGLGIMADDVAAGVVGAVGLNVVYRVFFQ
ncbi:MAG TPA: phosphatidylglycerophosphatase A [Dehalococcoidia bacterium]|nr:phosphatidylglycerophosphatase A [Dehalococcoidia bacterium]